MKKKYTFVTIMLTICSFLLGVWCTNSFGSTKVKDSRLQVFIEIYETLKDNWYYGDEETLDKIMNQVYSSIYDYNTDPYTFFTAAPIEGDKEQQTYGIGIVAVLNYDAEQENYNDPILNELGLLVIKTYQDSPSNKYGIKPLDYIVGIEENGNYISFEGKKYSEIRQYIVGELNSQTTFKIKRDNQELDIEVKRHSYTPESVTINNNLKDLYPNVEILQIEEFKESTGNEVGEVLEKIQSPETKDLVIGYDSPLTKPLNLYMERGQKIALVGANGLGKSTLLKSLLGKIQPLSGEVHLGDYQHIGYFEQEDREKNTNTCIEEVWQEFPSKTQYEIRATLAKCGLTTKQLESKIMVLSGGEAAKVRLCKLTIKESNCLILDEPTNHLDVLAKEALREAITEFEGTVILVCHEPDFYEGLNFRIINAEDHAI